MSDAQNETLSQQSLIRDIKALLLEAAVGPENPRETWFVDNEEDSGILGSLRGLSASSAFAVPVEGLDCIAAHVQHAAYSINLAIRAFRGGKRPCDRRLAGKLGDPREKSSGVAAHLQ
jgi:hypothetical protein